MAFMIGKGDMSGLSEIDLAVQIGNQGQYQEEFLKGLRHPVLSFNAEGEVLLVPILNYLKTLRLNIAGTMVSFYSSGNHLYEFCGSEPLDQSASVPISSLSGNTLKLKCRLPQRNDYQASEFQGDDRRGKANRRTKERKIGYIIEKVARWRNLYNGISTARGETVRVTLEEAAIQVGMAKKSLDDYLLQLRFGRRFGFNFQEHRHEKVGLLRAYVKQSKKLQTELGKMKDGKVPEHIKEQIDQSNTPACRSSHCCGLPFPCT
jgi:hypothetical protein